MRETTAEAVAPERPRASHIVWGLAVLFVLLAWAGACSMRGGEKVVMDGWADGFDTGQAAAQQADRPMLVMFTAGWCGPCQVFKKSVLSDADVQQRLGEEFVAVQVDLTDTSSSNPSRAVAERYGVRGIPSLIAMTPQGEPIASYPGGNDPAAFASWLDQVTQ